MPYHVFISYRRDGGDTMARLLYDRLKADGYAPFLDIEQMRSGKFNEQLYDRIAECEDFLMILSPGALDRCKNEDDWVRLELLEALRLKKNIVPFILRDFEFPKPPRITLSRKAIPSDILELRYYQGVAASQDYFDSSLERLKKLFRYQPGQTVEAPVPPYEQINEPPAPAMQAPQEITISDKPASRPVPQAKPKRNLGMVLIALFSVFAGLALGLGIGMISNHTQTEPGEDPSGASGPVTLHVLSTKLKQEHEKYEQRRLELQDYSSEIDDVSYDQFEYEFELQIVNDDYEEQLYNQTALQQDILLYQLSNSGTPFCDYIQAARHHGEGNLGMACLSYMRLGDYDNSREMVRTLQKELKGKITTGDYFTAGISTDGTIMFAGSPAVSNSAASAVSWQDVATLVAGSDEILGIKHDGTLLYTDPEAELDPAGHYIGAAAGNESFLAYGEDGSTFAYGQLYKTWKALSSWENVIAADAHQDFYIALTPNNELYVFDGSSSQSFEGNKVVWDIAAGPGFCLLMYEDGTVGALGNNRYGQCNVEDWHDIVAIAASKDAAFGLKSDGTVITTKAELQETLNSWTGIVAISAGAEHVVGLKSDGNVVAAGRNDEGQCDVTDWVLLEYKALLKLA